MPKRVRGGAGRELQSESRDRPHRRRFARRRLRGGYVFEAGRAYAYARHADDYLAR